MPAWRARSIVLRAMQDAGFIDDATRALAQATRPRIVRANGTPDSGYFADWVVSQLDEHCRRQPAEPVIVETSFDLETQDLAERAVAQRPGRGRRAASMPARRRWWR